MIAPQQLDTLDPQQMRQALLTLMAEIAAKDEVLERQRREVAFKQALVDKLTQEIAIPKRMKFAATSEKFCAGLSAEQRSLLKKRSTLTSLKRAPRSTRPMTRRPRTRRTSSVPSARRCRRTFPATRCTTSPRARHAPAAARCSASARTWPRSWTTSPACSPWSVTCAANGLAPIARSWSRLRWHRTSSTRAPTAGLLAQVLVAKFLDHLPLYRQEHIFERAGFAIARSTLAQWVGECGAQLQPLVDALSAELLRHEVLHADETPVAMLKPGNGKTHKAYIWTYCTTTFNPTKAVVFNFAKTRSGENVRGFLRQESDTPWKGKLVTDDRGHDFRIASRRLCRTVTMRRQDARPGGLIAVLAGPCHGSTFDLKKKPLEGSPVSGDYQKGNGPLSAPSLQHVRSFASVVRAMLSDVSHVVTTGCPIVLGTRSYQDKNLIRSKRAD